MARKSRRRSSRTPEILGLPWYVVVAGVGILWYAKSSPAAVAAPSNIKPTAPASTQTIILPSGETFTVGPGMV